MLLSMTGHGAAHHQQDGVSVTVDVRAVNSRYFKLVLRTSEGYASLESRVDESVRRDIRRGTVQIDLRVERESTPDDYRLNAVVLAGYQQQLATLLGELAGGEPIRLEALLALPGVVDERGARGVDVDSDWPLVQPALKKALERLHRMRVEEGRAMAADLAENCQSIRGHLDHIEQRAPLVSEAYANRLAERINKLLAQYEVTVEPSDVIREVGLFAERSDISEEVVRLRSHLEQFDGIMQLAESSGRKLEFVTQEMFREANTIGSKANDAEITGHVIEIKALVERIREMVQNVE